MKRIPSHTLLKRAVALVFLLMLGACNEQPASPKDEHSPLSTMPAGNSSALLPRRPLQRYFLAKTAEDRCEVYIVSGDTVIPKWKTHCPPLLDVGERIRLAGRACMREGKPDREIPVMCPSDLIYAEREDYLAARGDAGKAD